MSSSFIEFKGNGYWISDTFVSLMARYLIETRKRMPVKKHHWQKIMKDDLIPVALGHLGNGCSDLFLNKYLDRDYKIQDYLDWIGQTKNYLTSKGKFISKEELLSFDYMGDEVIWDADLETEILMNLFDELSKVIKGESGGGSNSNNTLPFLKVND